MTSRFGLVPAFACAVLLIAWAGPIDRAEICHSTGGDNVINELSVSLRALPAHLAHGDVEQGAYWPDGDADGFGDPDGEPVVCPAVGYVDNELDCDDFDGGVAPGEDELCDGLDNNCDGVVDEGCGCPCFTEAEVWAAIEATWSVSGGSVWYFCPDFWGRSYMVVTYGRPDVTLRLGVRDRQISHQPPVYEQFCSAMVGPSTTVDLPVTQAEHDACERVLYDAALRYQIDCSPF